MTKPPYATGPAGDPRQASQAATPPGPAPSFQYRPHDPYATFQAAEPPTGPVLPPAPTFMQRWGILAMEGRPKQVTWILQLLWIYLAVSVLLSLVSIAFASMIAAFFETSFGLIVNLVSGLVVAAVVVALIWAVAKESLGRFRFQDPRMVFYIGLGFLGLVALCGFIGAIKIPFAVVQLIAVLLVLGLVFTRPVAAWLRDRPGNQPRKAPAEPDENQPFAGYQPPPAPQWRDAPPQPPAAGPGAQGWPQPPQ